MSGTPRRPLIGRVSFRFALVLAVALLPLGLVSLWQTRTLNGEVQARAEAALVGEVLRVASGQVDTIRRVRGMLAVLALTVPQVIDDNAACSQVMLNVKAEVSEASVVAYVPRSGLMTCSSTGKTFDYSTNPLFDEMIAAKAPDFIVSRVAPLSGTSVLGVSHPVFSASGAYLGYVLVALPHDRLRTLDGESVTSSDGKDGPPLINYWTYDGTGEVLTATTELDFIAGQLPTAQRLAKIKPKRPIVFQDVSSDGISHTYSVVPLVQGDFYLMGSWNTERPQLLERLGVQAYLAPVMMWVVGLIVAAWAAEWMVTRHLRDLRRSITRFAGGDRRQLQTLKLAGAPVEFREIGEAYLGMTEAIMMGEAKLEDSLHQKEVLLREVHHRVKNNLQLIASIMNMQIRKAISPEARVLLKGLQDRVMSLATIHRGLYQTSGLVDVRADELLGDIARQIVSMSSGQGHRFDLALDMDDLRLTPDQAVPLSLLLTEAVTNAMKYSGTAPGNTSRIEVALKGDGGNVARLYIVNSIGPKGGTVLGESTGLGAQLLTAFAQQLGGTLQHRSEDGYYHLEVSFKVSPLNEAERSDEEPEGASSEASDG